MKKLYVLIALGAVLLQIQFAIAQKKQPTSEAVNTSKLLAFEHFVVKQMERDRIPGMTIGFVKGDYEWVKGFGFADLENKVPAKPQSSYQTASILKGMTAIAILQLVAQGKVDLDAEVQTYVPYFPKKKFPITIRQLLAHLGGIPHYKNEWEKYNKEPKSTRETIAIFADYDLVAEPGTRFSYSTYGYDLLGAVIEEVSGQPYGDYMRENVWKPLGMKDTWMDDPIKFIPNRVRGYQYFDDGRKNALFGEVRNAEYIDFSTRFAGGGARTTVVDMLKFGRAMNAGKLLTKEALELTRKPPVQRDGKISGFPNTAGYTMGALLLQLNGRFCMYYSGGQHGTSTYIFNFPSENLTIAFAMNIQMGRGFAYLQKLFQILMNEPLLPSVYIRGDKSSGNRLAAMQSVFDAGMSYFEIHGKQLNQTNRETAEAFAYFNKYASNRMSASDIDEAVKKIADGQQPFAGEPFTKLGSFMAQRLFDEYGLDKLRAYHAKGMVVFFDDFIKLCKKASTPADFRFNGEFEDTIARWASAFEKANDAYVRELTITPETDIEQVGKRLKTTFAGAEAYPDLTGVNGLNLFYTVQNHIINGDHLKAYRVARLSVDFYPTSDLSYTGLVLALVSLGRTEEVLPVLASANKINSDGAASIAGLDRTAYEFVRAGKVDFAINLLSASVKFYPNASSLYESLGDLYLRKNERNEAVKYFKKVLELDPNSASAKQTLQKLLSQH